MPTTSARFRDELAFRDYLRDYRDVVQKYAVLRLRLAERFEHDREAYTHAKTDFITETLRETADHPDAG